jgi:predicted TIM-barrel fold metal-dependent hydrolase
MPPVIDVHAHVFRGRDIPLKGYLLSRTYPEWYVSLFAPFLFTVIEKAIRGESHGILVDMVKRLTFAYTGKGYRRWADILSMGDMQDIAKEMISDFRNDRIALFVPLMVDYEYWFKHTKKLPIAEQIDSVYRDVILPFKGRIHPFAPFDPARELAYRAKLPGPGDPDGGPREKYSSLELAKEAVRNRGFLGVKVYNTLGYRPLGNPAVDKERRGIFSRNNLKRYCAFTGEQFDEVLSDLYRFCQREQVPITAHCGHDGIEAYPKASYDFGSPEYWRAVLEKYPRLHINLAHFGWSRPEEYIPQSRWSRFVESLQAVSRPRRSAGNAGTWVQQIAGMLAQYPSLYADVAHHGVTDDADLLKFQEAYAEMCKDYPGVIQKKLLFGIDWHVIARVDHYTEFLERYRRVLGESGIFTAKEMRGFLGGNALRFLGLLPPSKKDKNRWSKNWVRLKAFYRKNRIRPPQWYREASEDKDG